MSDEAQEPMPGYAQDEVFRQLLALARLAGLTVEFVDEETLDNALSESDPESAIILMAGIDEFPPGISPASVLAEEMATIMAETAQPKYQAVYILFDGECDSTGLISVALVQLAEMIVCAEAERKFKVIREIPFFD